MKQRTLRNISVSEIGFGAWAIGGSSWGPQDKNDSIAALHRALDLGVNFIDTAAGYGNGNSERLIAQVLKERGDHGKVIVATKTPPESEFWPPGLHEKCEECYSERYLRENVEERLRNLQTERLDVLQLHTWTRAWNRNPTAFEILKRMKEEGKIGLVGVSTPEFDQNSVIDLMRNGWVDVVQVIYNIFEQEPASELLPVAQEYNVGIIVRVVFDEGVLTGKFTADSTFPPDDFRTRYFAGDRLARAVARTEKIRADIEGSGYSLPETALKFALAHPATTTVIPGIRSVAQAEANVRASELPDLSPELLEKLHAHNWRRGDWYIGK